MYILERMHYVWPAAWRANQLLSGSKMAPQSTITLKATTPERHKRVAESLNEDSNAQNASGSVGSDVFRQPQGFTEGNSAQSHAGFPLQLDIQPTDSPAFYQPYSRWNADNLSGTLSTSVLPQQYSTGLVDERVQRNQDRPSRYPQYWSDYSAMGQMDAAYGMPVMSDMVSQQPAQADQQMYVPQDQYSLYSESVG